MKMIRFSKNIYSQNSIRQACTAYRELAKIDIVEMKDHFLVTFRKCQYDEETTVKEFENYLIGIESS